MARPARLRRWPGCQTPRPLEIRRRRAATEVLPRPPTTDAPTALRRDRRHALPRHVGDPRPTDHDLRPLARRRLGRRRRRGGDRASRPPPPAPAPRRSALRLRRTELGAIHGLPLGALIGQLPIDMAHPDDAALLAANHARGLRQSGMITTPTREKRWFHYQIIPLGDGVAVTSRESRACFAPPSATPTSWGASAAMSSPRSREQQGGGSTVQHLDLGRDRASTRSRP